MSRRKTTLIPALAVFHLAVDVGEDCLSQKSRYETEHRVGWCHSLFGVATNSKNNGDMNLGVPVLRMVSAFARIKVDCSSEQSPTTRTRSVNGLETFKSSCDVDDEGSKHNTSHSTLHHLTQLSIASKMDQNIIRR
jgi:hypothetical protein